MKFFENIVKGVFVILFIAISILLAIGVGCVVEALGGSDGAIAIGALATFILSGFAPAIALASSSVDFTVPSYGKPDKYKNHPRNRSKKTRKKRDLHSSPRLPAKLLTESSWYLMSSSSMRLRQRNLPKCLQT